MAKRDTKQPGTPATLALAKAGIPFTSHVYEHDPSAASYGLEAAAALGLAVELVFKTLMAEVDGRPVIAIVPVSCQVDLKSLAAAAGGRRAQMADPDVAQRITGYVVGGISPIGQRKASPTFVDQRASALPTMYVSGGRRGFDIGIAPADLMRATGGTWAAIARDGRP